jgi:hypothetical protein
MRLGVGSGPPLCPGRPVCAPQAAAAALSAACGPASFRVSRCRLAAVRCGLAQLDQGPAGAAAAAVGPGDAGQPPGGRTALEAELGSLLERQAGVSGFSLDVAEVQLATGWALLRPSATATAQPAAASPSGPAGPAGGPGSGRAGRALGCGLAALGVALEVTGDGTPQVCGRLSGWLCATSVAWRGLPVIESMHAHMD